MTTKVNNRMIDGATVNVLDFGAMGDGLTDDSAAFQAAFDHVYTRKIGQTNNYGGTIYIPDGEYIIRTRIFKTDDTTNRDVHIKWIGESQHNTRVIVENQFGFLRWTKTNYGLYCTMRDFSIIAKHGTSTAQPDTSSGNAIELQQFHSGNRRDRHYYFENLSIAPWDGAFGDHWFRGIFVTGGGRHFTNNVYVWGKSGVPRDQTWLGDTGFLYRDCYGGRIVRSGSWGMQTGYQYTSTQDPGPEGGTVDGCTFDAFKGIYVETPSINGEPGFTITGGTHVNYGAIGIEITNRRYVKIEDCLIYCEMTDGNTYYDILLTNVSYSELRRNVHTYPVTGNRYHVRILGSAGKESINNHISDCQFLNNAVRAISSGPNYVQGTRLHNNYYDDTLGGWWTHNGNPDWMAPTDITMPLGATNPDGQTPGMPVGSTLVNSSGSTGTTFWVKESGDATTNTGWVAK